MTNNTVMINNLAHIRILLPTLLTLILLPILIALGIWQLDRADQKQLLQAEYESRKNATPLHLSELPEKSLEERRYYPLTLTGKFDNTNTMLLDNRYHEHQIGYHVITPLIIRPNEPAVLINRGFIPLGQSRAQLPTIKPVNETITIEGNIVIPQAKPLMLSNDWVEEGQGIKRIQTLNLKSIEQSIKLSIYPFILQLKANQPHGYIRNWVPVYMPAAKHLGYAVQWFALAITLIVIYAVMIFRRYRL